MPRLPPQKAVPFRGRGDQFLQARTTVKIQGECHTSAGKVPFCYTFFISLDLPLTYSMLFCIWRAIFMYIQSNLFVVNHVPL